jgi:hypothetical protein
MILFEAGTILYLRGTDCNGKRMFTKVVAVWDVRADRFAEVSRTDNGNTLHVSPTRLQRKMF